MQRKTSCAGSTATAVIFALFVVLLTILTVYYFAIKLWWFPDPINEIGREIDRQFYRTLVITGLVFVLSQLALAWVVVRYRDRGQRAHYSHGVGWMEITWTLATIILFIGLGVYAQFTWAKIHLDPPGPDPVEVEVIGEQFKWSFRYPGPDGKFGRYKPLEQVKRERAAGRRSDPWQLDPADPAGQDDIVLGPGSLMAVPANRQVQIILRSKDVIHSFFVRELRLKQDAVPGMVVPLRFTAEKPGDYELYCTELCGMGHHQMRTVLKVLSQADYEQWLRGQTATE